MKKIILFASFILISGFSLEIWNYNTTPLSTQYKYHELSQPNTIMAMSPNLKIMEAAGLEIGHGATKLNLTDMFILLCLCYGLLLYLLSGGKDIAVLCFSFSIVLIGSITCLIFNLVIPITQPSNFTSNILYYRESVFSTMFRLFWIAFTYFVLLNLNKLRIFVNKENANIDGNNIIKNVGDAKKSTRIFAGIIDTVIALIICGKLMFAFAGSFLSYLEHSVFKGATLSVIILILFSNFIYNLFFELSFSTTPAKFLFGCKVVSTNSDNLTAHQVFMRTLDKLIPISLFANDSFDYDKKIGVRVLVQSSTGNSSS